MPIDRWLFFVIGFACFTFALYLGWRIRPNDRRTAHIVLGVCLIPVLVRALFVVFPGFEYQLVAAGFISPEIYALLRPWWATPFSIALFAVAAPHMASRSGHLALIAISLLVWGFGSDRLLATAVVDYHEMEGVVGRDGVCRQTTDFSCGPAAAVTLLHCYDLEATEAEMAELCWTNAAIGTDELCFVRGLRKRLVGRTLQPKIRNANWERLIAHGEPAAVTTKQRPLLEHWVVVLHADDRRVVVGDPSGGRSVMRAEEFRRVWTGVMVTLER